MGRNPRFRSRGLSRRRRWTGRSFRRRRRMYRSSKGFKSAVKRVIDSQAEKKFLDVSTTGADGTEVTWAGTLAHLTPIPVGTGKSARLGMKARIKSILVRGDIARVSESSAIGSGGVQAVYPATLRLMVIMWKGDSGDPPTASEITEAVSVDRAVLSARDLSDTQKIKVLWSKTMSLPGRGIQSGVDDSDIVWVQPGRRFFTMFKRCNIPIKWNETDTDGTGYEQNTIWLYAISDQESSATADIGPQMRFYSRVRFTDM